ncbi:PfkB family carbohydrate kinase [Paraglaciecola sp. 25GB23A]|uniref:PfkB family carbohydrate kinase n=1 Tax=Paraglaciecola sp. 25GB23A TaxID=3156068 RepID=UPI0032AEE6AA
MLESNHLQHVIDIRQSLGRMILVMGNFNVLHPGHIRLLKFAKECGDTLVVGINGDRLFKGQGYSDEKHRFEIIDSLSHVDFSFINNNDIETLIATLQPWAIVKGNEYQSLYNPEKAALDVYGGKLIFSSGNSRTSSQSQLTNIHRSQDVLVDLLNGYLNRQQIKQHEVHATIKGFQQKNVVVIGDTIVDQYVQCNAVGMSQEDPTIVVTPDESKYFLGGAGIVAGHAKSLGAKSVKYFSVLGNDQQANFAKQRVDEYGVESFFFKDDTRPTNLKTRYRVGNKTMLRVNEVRSHDIAREIQLSIIAGLSSIMDETDLLLFSDFNYGMLPQELVDDIVELARTHNVVMAADSQTSSQVGDISRFKQMHLITPTEREVRVALRNDKDGLVILGQKLTEVSCCQNLLITLADEGIFIHKPKSSELWENDRIKALSANVVDPAGAGDCLFAAAALSIACGANIWQASFVGSVAAACQVGNIGNLPIDAKRFNRAIDQFWVTL